MTTVEIEENRRLSARTETITHTTPKTMYTRRTMPYPITLHLSPHHITPSLSLPSRGRASRTFPRRLDKLFFFFLSFHSVRVCAVRAGDENRPSSPCVAPLFASVTFSLQPTATNHLFIYSPMPSSFVNLCPHKCRHTLLPVRYTGGLILMYVCTYIRAVV